MEGFPIRVRSGSLGEMRLEFLPVAFMAWGNPCLCGVCGFLPLEVISVGVFHVGTPVCSAARDPWRGLALACVLHGSCSSLERAFWLFCEMYTRAFGVSLVY